MTFKTDVVVVRTRLDNLMNRTDADYRKHRQRMHIHGRGGASGGGVIGDGAMVSTAGGAGTGAGGGSVASGEGGGTFAPQATDAVPTSRRPSGASGAPLRLPPIQPRGASLALSGGVAAERQETTAALQTGALGENVGSPRIPAAVALGTPDPALKLPAVSENATPAERAKAQAASDARERETYERRMSTIVAAADPWNLAPHTKPRPNKLAAMSFYKKPKSASSGAK
jgi:hypothetical protein